MKLSKNILVIFFVFCLFSQVTVIADDTLVHGDYEFNSSTGIIVKYKGQGGSIEIPSEINGVTVTKIGPTAFLDCDNLTSVVIPNTVTELIMSAFRNCKNLVSVIMPDSVTHLGAFAFSDCSSLISIKISKNISTIGIYAFSGCTSLESIIIPSCLTTICDNAFKGCTNLASVVILNNNIVLEKNLFAECYNLTVHARIGSNAEVYAKDNAILFLELIEVEIYGIGIEFDKQPIMDNDRVLVPMRKIFEELGAVLTWDNDTQTITANKDNIEIIVQIGKDKMFVNDKEVVLDVPAKLITARTFVPIRAVSEAFNKSVSWIQESHTVEIK